MNNTGVCRNISLEEKSLLHSPDTGIGREIPITELFVCTVLKVCVEIMPFFLNPLI